MFRYSQLIHNGSLVQQCEDSLNSLLNGRTNTYLSIENPDGTVIRLQRGFKINHLEIIGMDINEDDMKLYHDVFSRIDT